MSPSGPDPRTDSRSVASKETSPGSTASPDRRTRTRSTAAAGASSTAGPATATSSRDSRLASASLATGSSLREALRLAPSAEVRRPLLLGEAPSQAGDRYHDFPLSGRPAQFLCEAAWLPRDGTEAWFWTLTRHFETLNAIERHRDAYPWSEPRARARWDAWLREEGILEEYRRAPGDPRPPFVVVCVGRKAAAAVGIPPDRPWFKWTLMGTSATAVIPHTSGRNRVLNEPGVQNRMGTVLREAIRLARRPCPGDTNGDGNCGGDYCPACGPLHRLEVYP